MKAYRCLLSLLLFCSSYGRLSPLRRVACPNAEGPALVEEVAAQKSGAELKVRKGGWPVTIAMTNRACPAGVEYSGITRAGVQICSDHSLAHRRVSWTHKKPEPTLQASAPLALWI